ncbi:MAG: TolC family protein [Muribaculaceae bacterium]|nr:TolC family protein [Muribaculaceae bacterium]
MKFCTSLIISLVLGGTTVHAATELTLDDCLKIALSESPTIQVADIEIKRTDYSRKDVLAQLLPTVSFGAQYNRTLAKQTMYMNLGSYPGMGDETEGGTTQESSSESKKNDGIKMGLDNSYSVGFQASVPLIAPQLWASLKLSDAQILQSVEQARASRLDLINQVKDAYYALLLAKDSKKVIQQSYDMAALTHDIYSKRFALGDASDYDVLRTSVAMKNVEPELIQADIAIRQAHLQLMVLMGVDRDTDFDVAGQLSDYEKTMYEDVMSLPTDYSNNTSLVMNNLQNQTLEQALRVNKMAWYPTLALSANYNWTAMSNGSPFKNLRWSPYSTVGLTLSFPLFQGGSRYNAIKSSELQLMQNRLQRDNIERTVDMQVKLAKDNIHLNVKQIATCSESVKQADRAHTIMQESFNIGAASYLDLRDSELSLTRSRLSYFQAIYNYLVANSDLEYLLGSANTDINK